MMHLEFGTAQDEDKLGKHRGRVEHGTLIPATTKSHHNRGSVICFLFSPPCGFDNGGLAYKQ